MRRLPAKEERMAIKESIIDLIGHTPLLNVSQAFDTSARIVGKLEYLNPAGSVKDRIAWAMIEDAEQRGLLQRGSTIIEPTSGNTGIALASIAAARGYRVILTMPESMSIERRGLQTAYGAEIVLTDGSKGMPGAIQRARELAAEIPGSFVPSQFDNPANPAVHERTTGPEIWEDAEGQVDVFVAGVGTGGTLTGTAHYLRQKNPDIRVVAVEPSGSNILTGGASGPHKIQGIGPGFVPKTLDTQAYDEVIDVNDDDAFAVSRKVAKTVGLLVGISSGAALYAASQVARRPEYAGKTIVAVLPDSGGLYLSTSLYR